MAHRLGVGTEVLNRDITVTVQALAAAYATAEVLRWPVRAIE